jgi:hypothetical protein
MLWPDRQVEAKRRTSSLLVCFCRLALTDEPPASLMAVLLLCEVFSKTGRGIFEVDGLLAKEGMPPRPWALLGVPLMVLPDILDNTAAASCSNK